MKFTGILFTSSLSVFGFLGCTEPHSPDVMLKNDTPALSATRWRLVRVKDNPSTPPPQAHLIFEETGTERVIGSDGCNRFGGSYTVDENRIRFGNLIATRMICPDEQTASGFLEDLAKVNRFVLRGEKLRLKEDAVVLLEFNAATKP